MESDGEDNLIPYEDIDSTDDNNDVYNYENFLFSMFYNVFDAEYIQNSLLATQHDVERALAYLIALLKKQTNETSDNQECSKPTNNTADDDKLCRFNKRGQICLRFYCKYHHNDEYRPHRQKMCRHFLNGDCRLKNCKYSHDTSIPCDYWLMHICEQDTTCPFIHSIDFSIASLYLEQQNNANAIQSDFAYSQTDYPELPEAQLPDFKEQNDGKLTYVSILKEKKHTGKVAERTPPAVRGIEKIKDKYPEIDESQIKSVYENCKGDEDRTIFEIEQMFPEFIDTTSEGISKQNSGKIISKSKKPVSYLYKMFRQEAAFHAKKRNKCFQTACKAYYQQNHELAKKKSLEGRQHHKMMKELNEAAAAQIFYSLNSQPTRLDLHGLHVNEFIEPLRKFLNKSAKKRFDYVFIITGHGRHSYNEPQLLPAVKDFLTSNGYNYYDSSADHSGGVLKVITKDK